MSIPSNRRNESIHNTMHDTTNVKDNANVKDDNDEESRLLASVGSTRTSQSTYERRVLEEATLSRRTPELTGIGFPQKLVPILTQTPSRIPSRVLETVLNKLRNERTSLSESQLESRKGSVLHVKYQLLLACLAGKVDDGREEVRLEERRRNRFRFQGATGAAGKKRVRSAMANDGDSDNGDSRDGNSKNEGGRIRRKAMEGAVHRSERLERIKQGEDYSESESGFESKVANGNNHVIKDDTGELRTALSSTNTKKKRTTMMQLKKRMVEEEGEVWIDPEELWQKRLARIEERRRRRGHRTKNSFKENNQSENRESLMNDGEEEVEWDGAGDVKGKDSRTTGTKKRKRTARNGSFQKRSTRRKQTLYLDCRHKRTQNDNITESKTSPIVSTAESNDPQGVNEVEIEKQETVNPPPSANAIITSSVLCPICQQTIPLSPITSTKSDGADELLSRHMSTCTGGVNGRVTRSSLRKRSTSASISYKEVDEEDDDDDDNNDDVDINYQNDGKDDEAEAMEVSNKRGASKNEYLGRSEKELDKEEEEKKQYDANDNQKDQLLDNGTSKLTKYERNKTIDDYHEYDYEDRVDEWTETGIASMKDMSERDLDEDPPGAVSYSGGLHVPAWINDRLFGYQRTALRWMWELHLQGAGGIVGDEMGLGKTVQLCSFLGTMAANRKLRSILIICPATMLMHWLNELSTWAPGIRRILVHKSAEQRGGGYGDEYGVNHRNPSSRSISIHMLRKVEKWLRRSRSERTNEPIDERDLEENDPSVFCGTGYAFVTTYENIRRAADIWVSHPWSYVVLDEGQKIRNPDADVTLACKRFRTPHRLLLSGTPIQNDLRELWSLFDFVFPGRLGTLPAFESEFADTIKKGGYSNASPMQVQLAYRCALVLRDLINPYLLRRQKKDVNEVSRMPGKTEQVLFCKLSSRQRALYEAYLKSDEVTNIIRGTAQCFRPIINLRKICNHPDLVCRSDQASFDSFLRNGFVNDEELDDYSSDDDALLEDGDGTMQVERAGKLEVLAKILPLWKRQGHRVLIFSQWKKMLNIIQRFTSEQEWKFMRLDGNTNVASRQNLVDTFNSDDSYFGMLMTTRTGGVGLNLTGADRIILYDPDWNPQTDAQARERAWRFGQKNEVTVYRLITAGTIEEKIYHRQIFKTAVSNQVLQDPRQRRLFSQKDLRDLFTLKPDVESVAKGGDGVTETGEVMKGQGVVDFQETEPLSEADDNKDTLEVVMKSKGLAGIFDHNFVDAPSSTKSLSVREMEVHAKKVAEKAAKAILHSSMDAEDFTPTWTGSAETETQRFGGSRRQFFSSHLPDSSMSGNQEKETDRSTSFDLERKFGGARSAGLTRSPNKQKSSGSLLAQLQHRRNQVSTGGRDGNTSLNDANEDAIKHNALIKRIHDFIRKFGARRPGRGPTTDQILKNFQDVQDHDAAIFRRMLKYLAEVKDGVWLLKNSK